MFLLLCFNKIYIIKATNYLSLCSLDPKHFIYIINLPQQHFLVVIIAILLMRKMKFRQHGTTMVQQQPALSFFWTCVSNCALPH